MPFKATALEFTLARTLPCFREEIQNGKIRIKDKAGKALHGVDDEKNIVVNLPEQQYIGLFREKSWL